MRWLRFLAVVGIAVALFASSLSQGQAHWISGSSIVSLALTHHERYIYGITDCSALTKKVYQRFGINLPRTSRQQATIGKPVSIKHLQKGDLVFFATGRKGVISHVGIYAGGGKMVDAEYNGIRQTGIFVGPTSHYWKSKYIKARRVL
ncbi:NlpC/P60 family protein [Sporolactobacillus shoreae]|uniref:NlpC/P60 family protein n=1 Tax=Sporolactobacillus shoreae TaxID=1465501 RepID=A0A4Z0GLK8_9BACL|nr:C40 family peptidase [Sporolactobacillus shoreae]TGA96581.1 NlpC/P60 family protein [Sporolactobacillus shoreae]